MPALENHLPATGPNEEKATHGDVLSVSNNGDVFVQKEYELEGEEILKGTEGLSLKVRGELFDLLNGRRAEQYKRNEILLDAANINVHDLDHQDRDAIIVDWLFTVFADKLNHNFREPVIAASMVHDRQYIAAATLHANNQLARLRRERPKEESTVNSFKDLVKLERFKWMCFLTQLEALENRPAKESADLWKDGSFPKQIGKHALDPHAQLGEEMMRDWMEHDEEFQRVTSWNEQQGDIAAWTVRDHSNGSEYNPLTSPLEVQVLRLADKLDNTHHRIHPSMLSRESLEDSNNCHRYVPASIRSYDLHVDRANEIFTVEYHVDLDRLLEAMQREVPDFTYNQQDFLRDFQRAYGEKSMPIAAEVAAKLFAKEGEMYSEKAVFQVRFNFGKGVSALRTYKPLPTEPAFG